jgi:HAD superfamily hydrolase (TIGR01509 family)
MLIDFDGTLVDSSPLHDSAYRRVLRQHRPELLRHYRYGDVKGRPTREALTAVGVRGAAELAFLVSAKQRAYRDQLCRLELLPGAREVLEALRGIGSAMFLVTSGSRISVMAALRATGIGQFFSGVTTGDDVRAGKPAPDPYRYCLLRHGLRPHRCVAVEDSTSGVISAREAGVPVIGVHDRGTAGQVDEFFPSLWDVEHWIRSTSAREEAS